MEATRLNIIISLAGHYSKIVFAFIFVPRFFSPFVGKPRGKSILWQQRLVVRFHELIWAMDLAPLIYFRQVIGSVVRDAGSNASIISGMLKNRP